MATALPPQATPSQDGSLESAASAFQGLLSLEQSGTESNREAPPEQRPARPRKAAPVAEQAPTAPEIEEDDQSPPESESESADEQEQTDEQDDEQPTAAEIRRLKVKLPDGEQELPEDEVVKGYLRTADYTRKTMELARQRKEFEEREIQPVRQEREQYRSALVQLETALKSLTPEEPDWTQLRQTLPADQFAAELLSWQENQKRVEKVRVERERVEAAQAADAAHGFQRYVQEQQAKLQEAIPDFADPEKAVAINKRLVSFAQSKGFTAEELQQVTDHRLVVLLHDAMQHQQAQAKAPKVEQKIENALVTARPGASRSTAPKANKLDAAKQRLRQSGSLDDAAAAFAEII